MGNNLSTYREYDKERLNSIMIGVGVTAGVIVLGVAVAVVWYLFEDRQTRAHQRDLEQMRMEAELGVGRSPPYR